MRFDYVGFSLLLLGVSALQIFLDKGQEDDWFGSQLHYNVGGNFGCVPQCSRGMGVAPEQPIVDVKLFKMINFSSASVMMFISGAVVFSSTVLMPSFFRF